MFIPHYWSRFRIIKAHMGSWSYPEEAYSKVGGIPLYSRFMYASVAIYIWQSWRRINLHMYNWPKPIWAVGITNQAENWSIVHIGKISSWSLLVIISVIIVAQLKEVRVALS